MKSRREFVATAAAALSAATPLRAAGEYKMAEGLLWRAEYRHDWSDQLIFERGPSTGFYGKQDTVSIAFVAFFGPPR